MSADAAANTGTGTANHRCDVILVADDYAISGGVTAGIETLARKRRLSAASAIVTLPRWGNDAPRLTDLRGDIAIGLHINLTLASPLGRAPSLAPRGVLPNIRALTAAATSRRIDVAEVTSEIARQLDAFERGTGRPPDFVDGHQHAHALPLVRDGLLAALTDRFPDPAKRPLVRLPIATLAGTARGALGKAAFVSSLSIGFGAAVRRAGFPTNDSFAGFSTLSPDRGAVAADLKAAARGARGLHLVMCHPGVPSRELEELDPVLERRAAELAILGDDNALTERLWLPRRAFDGPAIDWRREREALA